MLSPYRKKPVVVHAIRVPAKIEDFQEFVEYANTKDYTEGKERTIFASEWDGRVSGHVITLEGRMEFATGDWIIEGVAGELYPCRDDIFRATYEEAGEDEDKGQISDGYHTFNELYEHRHWLFVNLMASHKDMSWASRTHSDGSSFDGWFICGMNLPTGQVSYHLPDRMWSAVEEMGLDKNPQPEWDGHTAEQVVERMAKWGREPNELERDRHE